MASKWSKYRGSDVVRFFSKVPIGADGCWEWQGARNPNGRGQLGWHGKVKQAHRVSWEILNGPIPDGMKVLHHCDNGACVKIDHLYLGTQAQNVQDCMDRNRWATGVRDRTAAAVKGWETRRRKNA